MLTEVVLSSSAGDDQALVWDLRTLAVLGSYKANPSCARHVVDSKKDSAYCGIVFV